MIDKLHHITVNDKEYPMAFTLNVMESIQETYGSIDNWSKALEPEPYINLETKEEIKPEPKMKDIIWTFKEFINEGIDIENEEKGESRPFLTHKQVGRLVTYIGFTKSGALIKSLTTKSTDTGEEPKNEMTTQNQN